MIKQGLILWKTENHMASSNNPAMQLNLPKTGIARLEADTFPSLYCLSRPTTWLLELCHPRQGMEGVHLFRSPWLLAELHGNLSC